MSETTTTSSTGRDGLTITRSITLDDLAQRAGSVHCETCGQDATGRVIDAYAARFLQPAEIDDQHGHYIEDIDPAAWNKRLSDLSRSKMGLRSVAVFYHHGLTLHGTPSERGAHPVGHPMAIRADGSGLLTATHYGRTPLAEQTFMDLVDGNISGHSWTGRIVRSNPDRVPRRAGADLPRVRRLELGLAEYGPTPIPYYENTVMVGQRATVLDVEAPAEREVITVAGPPPSQADIARRIRMARITGRI